MALFSSFKRFFGAGKKDPVPDLVKDTAPDLVPDTAPDLVPDMVPDLVPDLLKDTIDATPLSDQGASEPVLLAAPASIPASAPESVFSSKFVLLEENVEQWQAPLLLALRDAEPRLSVWLDIALQDIIMLGKPLQARLYFLLTSLGVAAPEADLFVEDFAAWADNMEYERLVDFRGELQYRLALALDMEDEEDERSRLFLQLSEGLAATRLHFGQHLAALFSRHTELDARFWEELEEIFIMADMGVVTATKLVERLRKAAHTQGLKEPSGIHALLTTEIIEILQTPRRVQAINPPEIQLIVGVNGVGKTTTIAKLAYRATMQGKRVLLAGADTFRAAATEQLGVWAQRTGAAFHTKGANADPAAVAYEATQKAVEEGFDLLLIDTAGRLHTKINLMAELTKMRTVVGKKHAGAPHSTLLIIDATTGQNALQQVKFFHKAAKVDSIILTKLDGTAKGGIAIAIALEFGIPISYVGLGEKMEDLRPFDPEAFAKALL